MWIMLSRCNSKAVTYGKDELRARKPARQRGKLDLMSIYDRRNHEERTELTKEEASLPPNNWNITVPDVDRLTQVVTLAHAKTVAEEATGIVEVERRHPSTLDGGAPSTAAAPPRRAPPAGQASRTDDARVRARA